MQTKKKTISEAFEYHQRTKTPLAESIFRVGSPSYFELFREARKLFNQGVILSEADTRLLAETDIGEFGTYRGERVPLDCPMVMEQDDLFPEDQIDSTFVYNGLRNENSHGRRISSVRQNFQNFSNWFGDSNAVDSKDRPLVFFHGTRNDFDTFKTHIKTHNSYGILGNVETTRSGIFVTPDLDTASYYANSSADDRAGVVSPEQQGANIISVYVRSLKPFDLRRGYTDTQYDQLESVGFNPRVLLNIQNHWELFDDEMGDDFVKALKTLGYDSAIIYEDTADRQGTVAVWVLFSSNQLKSVIGNVGTYSTEKGSISEAEYANREVELNSPRRNPGEGKKYMVYVKDPDTGKVKKIMFGDQKGGLTAKINDPEASKSFAARHQCEKKTNKLAPGYWACRLPRYAKALGLAASSSKWW